MPIPCSVLAMAPLSLLARLLKVAASLLLPSPPPQSLSLFTSAILETERRCESAAAETERKQGGHGATR